MVKSIYTKHGIGSDDEKQVTLEKCPRCNAVLVPEARLCHQCALVLDAAFSKEVEEKSKLIPDVLAALQNNTEFQRVLAEAITKSAKSAK